MAEDTVPIASNPVKPFAAAWPGFGLRGKMMVAFGGVLLLTSALNIALLYHFTGRMLESRMQQQAAVVTTNLSDVAAAQLMAKNSLELHALVTKYARLDGVAYVFITDAKNEIAAHSLGSFPADLRDSTPGSALSLPERRIRTWRGRSVLETRVPILEGQVGTAHVGMWEDAIQSQTRAAVFPLIGLVALVLFAGLILIFVLVPAIIRPVQGLRAAADRISRGDLDAAVETDGSDEIGDLACSLERMRASLKAAMNRLNAV